MPAPSLSEEKMREALDAFERHGEKKKAADELGIPASTLASRLDRAYKYFDIDPAIRDSMRAAGTNLVPKLAWAKTKSEDGTAYSVLLKPEECPQDILERIRDTFEGMAPAAPVAAPGSVLSDLMTLYPMTDVHFGMLAWGAETGGQDYDINLATSDIKAATEKVLALTPNSQTAVLVLNGDTFHADDNNAQTPAHKHSLDVDSRHEKVVQFGVDVFSWVVERLLQHHEKVIVRVNRGNHDEHSHLILKFALQQRYRDNPRIDVDMSPQEIFMHQHGRCGVFIHHGDKVKRDQLLWLLTDICKFWSDAPHRYCFTGHKHSEQSKDFPSIRWEQLRAVCPPDAYGAMWGGKRQMNAMTFHKEDGLVLRAADPIERRGE